VLRLPCAHGKDGTTTGEGQLMHPWHKDLAGRIEEHVFRSAALADNPLGDPAERPLWVYLPPGYDESAARYPSVYVIQGLTGQIDMWRNRSAFRANFPELVDEVFATDGAPHAIVVFVDAWTSLGGSQYLNSPGTGRYHDYLCQELVPFVDGRYRTDARREKRAIQGKSSGGYGALVTPMLRPDLFGALASHAGDALFEACYLPEFAKTARALRDEYGGSYDAFWKDFRSRPAFSKDSDAVLLNDWCMAACYSAEEDGTVTLPFDVETGRLIEDVWKRWLQWDPVRMVPRYADAIRSLRAIYIDAGKKDEWFLDNGAVAVKKELDALGVDCEFELFDAGHMSIEYRYPKSLAFLCRRMAGD
jgi:S-formylglutathione hydrolase FrmB